MKQAIVRHGHFRQQYALVIGRSVDPVGTDHILDFVRGEDLISFHMTDPDVDDGEPANIRLEHVSVTEADGDTITDFTNVFGHIDSGGTVTLHGITGLTADDTHFDMF